METTLNPHHPTEDAHKISAAAVEGHLLSIWEDCVCKLSCTRKLEDWGSKTLEDYFRYSNFNYFRYKLNEVVKLVEGEEMGKFVRALVWNGRTHTTPCNSW